jgi:hypothetical protein
LLILSSEYLLSGISSQKISIVNKPIGLMEPLTVTTSIFLANSLRESENTLYKSDEISKGTPYYLVAASNLDAILTLGLKYDASILNSEPIAPSMPHPMCNPNPIFTL